VIYRFYRDLANARITELEQEAQDARLARRRGVHVKSLLAFYAGVAPRLVTRLRRVPGLHRPGFGSLAHPLLVSPQCQFDVVADHSQPGREVLGGACHSAGSRGLLSTRDDSTPCLGDSQFHNPATARIKEKHRSVRCVVEQRCQVR